jgi:predicted DCC family thiol-disulfide oxidoreductase YuxK
VNESPERGTPLLVYDGECGFCARCVERFVVQAGDSVEVARSQDVARSLELPLEDCERSVQFLDGEGHRTQGAEAVFRALAAAGKGRWLWAYQNLPFFGGLTELGYRGVAQNRAWISKWVRLAHGPDLRVDPWRLTRSVYLRALGLVLLLAVTSYWTQIEGLNGQGGIRPAVELVDRIDALSEASAWSSWEYVQALPSLVALSPSDTTLHVLCFIASLGALLLLGGALSGLGLLMVFLGYGSIVATGGIFTGYQWDHLLLEVTFASLLIAPWTWRAPVDSNARVSRAGILVLRVLLFKFMFLNGWVKIQSGDVVWRELTALQFHYWTQPIPHAASWYAHHLPGWVHGGVTYVVFMIELVFPFFILGPRRLRLMAAGGFALLMLAIVATGNYGTFNWMTLALAITWLDDGAIRALTPARWRDRLPDTRARLGHGGSLATRLPRGIIASVLVVLSLWMVNDRGDLEVPTPDSLDRVAKSARSLRISGSYGAFADMTERRLEILIEASVDGAQWRPYVLPYKTLALDQSHGFAGTHMPRLDWQLWFAALRRNCKRTRWYGDLLRSLLRGSPEVHALFEQVPFPDGPTYIRSSIWRYEFTSPEEREETGNVWRRTRMGEYCPTVTLKNGELALATLPQP